VVSEPITALTDFGLAAITAFWALLVFRSSDRRAPRLFAVALAAIALATLTGGLYHTFPGRLLWKATALSAGLVSFFLGFSVAVAFLSAAAARPAFVVLLVQFCVYAIAALFIDDFRLVIADYGSVMLAILFLCAIRWSEPAARWIAAAIVVSFAASALQMTSIRVGPLNHNDVYHFVDVVALYFFYRGGMLLTKVPPTTQPR
jgi:uncharacterized protein DUF6962